MPSRRDIFSNGNYYHIFNKTIDDKKIFKSKKPASYFLKLLEYYRSTKCPTRYSRFLTLPAEFQQTCMPMLAVAKHLRINILAYCLMPNHYHLLLKQTKQNGIVRYMSDIINALTRYYNQLNQRKGPLFLPQFRSRMIRSTDQLRYVSRYIHRNPLKAGMIDSAQALADYSYSSYRHYADYPKILTKESIVHPKKILRIFSYDPSAYEQYVMADDPGLSLQSTYHLDEN